MKKLILTLALVLPVISSAAERPGKTVVHCTNFRVDSGTFVDVREIDENFTAYVTRMVNTMSKTTTVTVIQGREPVKRLFLTFRDELTAGSVFSLSIPVDRSFEESGARLKTQGREEALKCRIDPSFINRV